MKRTRVILSVVLALTVLFTVAIAVLAEGNLQRLLSTGKTLLFETDNVTVSGQVEFRLNGERFKTASILYMQDGVNSHWQLDLLTPRRFRSDQKTGYTVIANGERIYAMEHYHAGTYKSGSDQPSNAIIRRSTRSDALLAAATASADVIEGMLPADAIVSVKTDDLEEMKITLTKDTTPALLNASLNLAADFALNRFMDIDFDSYINSEYAAHFEDFPTITQAILYTTESFVLGDTSVAIRLDDQDRVIAASGTVTVLLKTRYDEDIPLEIVFDLTVSDYGKTYVKVFDPDTFGVVPYGTEIPEEEVDEDLAVFLRDRALEILSVSGFDRSEISEDYNISEDDGIWYLGFTRNIPDSTTLVVGLNENGNLLFLSDNNQRWYMADAHEPDQADLTDEQLDFLNSFMEQAFPDLAKTCAVYSSWMQYDYDGSTFLYVGIEDDKGEETAYRLHIRIAPSLQVVSWNCTDY